MVRHSLTRSSSPIDLAVSPQTNCSEVNTAGCRYLLAKRVVPEGEVREVIGRTIDAQQIDPAWASWDGDAEVSVAIPLGREHEDEDKFALFTFMPMDVTSPLGGHLNAPFYTKLARVDLSEEVLLNDYFLDVAADLCAELIALLVEDDGRALEEGAGIVIDLLAWDEQHVSRLERTLAARGLDLRESKLVPRRLAGSLSWISLEHAYSWDGIPYAFLTADRLGQIGAELVDSSIGARRVERLEALHVALQAQGMTPSDDVLAGWFERLASSLVSSHVRSKDWNAFYEDLARHFEGTGRAQSLQGRSISSTRTESCESRPLGRAKRSRVPTVFFPPRRASDADDEVDDVAENEEELRVPKSLQRAVCFLHDGISLREREGPTTQGPRLSSCSRARSSSNASTGGRSSRICGESCAADSRIVRSEKPYGGCTSSIARPDPDSEGSRSWAQRSHTGRVAGCE